MSQGSTASAPSLGTRAEFQAHGTEGIAAHAAPMLSDSSFDHLIMYPLSALRSVTCLKAHCDPCISHQTMSVSANTAQVWVIDMLALAAAGAKSKSMVPSSHTYLGICLHFVAREVLQTNMHSSRHGS